MDTDKLRELMKDAFVAACISCRNWTTIDFLGKEVSGCGCNMEPSKCILNPLLVQLKKMREEQQNA